MNFKAESITHQGGRNYNEDNCGSLVLNGKGCWVVADGLGGHRGGKEASRITVATVLREFERQPEVSPRNLEHCILAAQAEILRAQSTDQELAEMRSTVAVLMADAEVYLFGHVGDTRLYLFREGSYVLRTKDHSVPQALVNSGSIRENQIRTHEDRNRLLKSLGKEDHVKPTVSKPEPVFKGDVFLLCTDGFWEYVLESDMEISLAKSDTPLEFLKEMERRLRSKVSEGNDNYTGLAMFHGTQRLAPVAAKQSPVINPVVPAPPRSIRMIWLIPTAAMAIMAILLALTSSGQKIANVDKKAIQPAEKSEPTEPTENEPTGSQPPAGESLENKALTPQGETLPKLPPTPSPEQKASPSQAPSKEAKPATKTSGAEGKKKVPSTQKKPAQGKTQPKPSGEKPKPKAETQKPVPPKVETPQPAEPKVETPKPVEPKAEAPKPAEPKAEAPKPAEQKAEAPKPAEPKAEAPKPAEPKPAEPKPAEPKTAEPKAETPKPSSEPPKAETPKPETEPSGETQKQAEKPPSSSTNLPGSNTEKPPTPASPTPTKAATQPPAATPAKGQPAAKPTDEAPDPAKEQEKGPLTPGE